jgi:hypothetical protein
VKVGAASNGVSRCAAAGSAAQLAADARQISSAGERRRLMAHLALWWRFGIAVDPGDFNITRYSRRSSCEWETQVLAIVSSIAAGSGAAPATHKLRRGLLLAAYYARSL